MRLRLRLSLPRAPSRRVNGSPRILSAAAIAAGLIVASALVQLAFPQAEPGADPQGGPSEETGPAAEEPADQEPTGAGREDAGPAPEAGATDPRLDLQEERERTAEETRAPGGPAVEDAATAGTPGTESVRFREAYRVLADAEASGDPDGLDPVKELFEHEIDAGRNLARAHNGLGRYYLQQHEHVITILESIQKLFNWDHITQARKNFRLATEADPAYVEAWYNWGIAARRAKDTDALREAVAALRKTVALDPTFRDAYRLLVVTLRDLGDYRASEQALAEWRASSVVNVALANLEEAYLALGVEGRTAEGARLYREGLAAAQTAEDVDAYFEDVKVLVGEDERKAYTALDVEGRKRWIEAFWQRAADEALVALEERIVEHYRRLNHVEHTYALAIPQRRHYSAISAYRPREQSGFDDRGVVYLRHGKPDDVARFTGPNVQRNESWLYRRPGGDLVFHFVSDEDTEDFKLVTSLADALTRGPTTLGQRANSAENADELFVSRSRFDPIYNRLAFQFDPMLLREEEEDVAADVKRGTTTASYVPESPDSLPFYAYPAVFRDVAGRPEVLVYLGVPTGELEMQPAAGGTRFAYAAQMVIAGEDEDDEVAGRAADSVAVEVPADLPRDRGVLLPDVLRASVAPGEYRYRLRVTDRMSRATGTLGGELEVPRAGGFAASDVVLASRVEPATAPSKFDRSGLKVVPLPSLAFRPGQLVFVYYEIYGLEAGDDERFHYRTTYTVRTREKARNIAVRLLGSVGDLVGSRRERAEEVGIEVDREAPAAAGDRVAEYISLDLNESEPGPYEIVVEVEDRSTGRKVERRAPFVLVG